MGFIIVQGGNLYWLVSLIQIGPAILMIESLLQVMFSVWDLDMSLGLVRNNKLFLFIQQKQNIEPHLMLVRKLYGFDRSFQSLDSSSSSLLHFGVTIKVPPSLPKINSTSAQQTHWATHALHQKSCSWLCSWNAILPYIWSSCRHLHQVSYRSKVF